MRTARRIKNIVSSNVNHALDKMEDPEKMIRYSISEMEETLEKAEKSARETENSLRISKHNLDEQKSEVARWDVRAQMAVKNNMDDLAKEAIAEKLAASSRAKALAEEVESLTSIFESQKTQIAKLKEKLSEMKAKEKQLIARAKYAKEKLEIEKKLSETDSLASIRRFDDMEEKIVRLEAMANETYSCSRNEGSFAEMESQADVEAELQAIKDSLNPKKKAQD